MSRFLVEGRGAGKALVGICFGHQLIAKSLGGRVELVDRGWMLGLHEIRLSKNKNWIHEGSGPQSLYFVNQDQVTKLPPSAEVLATSDTCPYAMFTVGDSVLGLQAHPEQPRTSIEAFAQRLLEIGRIDQQDYAAAMASLSRGEAQGHKVAAWITRFLIQSRG